jgi:mannose PTS system EIIA component
MVAILIVAHEGVGEALLEVLSKILGERPPRVELFPIPISFDLSVHRAALHQAVERLDDGAGVLMLADLVGASPCNLATDEIDANARLITGLNLSMLFKLVHQRHLNLDELAERALRGGREGVMEIAPAHCA